LGSPARAEGDGRSAGMSFIDNSMQNDLGCNLDLILLTTSFIASRLRARQNRAGREVAARNAKQPR
jgi:hypothetical protein